ncbi:HD domain-containing protein [Candidatus Micrarchaeota archaeon]|nr:HD domain-containing protein [Candidatus Micrarchaeota archaeon]
MPAEERTPPGFLPTKMVAGSFGRMANRLSLTVLHEPNPKSQQNASRIAAEISRNWKYETGVKAIELHFDEHNRFSAKKIREMMDHAIEGTGVKDGHRGGWGQNIIIRGDLTDGQKAEIERLAEQYRVSPLVLDSSRDLNAKRIAQDLIQRNTTLLPSAHDLHQLKEAIRGESDPGRSAYPLMQLLARLLPEVAFTQKQKEAGAHVRGTVALAMQTSPDPMKSPRGTDMRTDLVEYKAEAGPEAPWGRRVQHLPVMPLTDSTKRIVRWWNGGLNEEGKSGFSFTANLHEDDNRSKMVDEHLAKPGEGPTAPFGELIVPLGIITPDLRRQFEHKLLLPENHVAAVHAIHLDKIPRQLALKFQEILQDRDINDRIVQNWFTEQLDHQAKINVKSRIKQLEDHDPYTRHHSERVGKWMKKIALIMDRLHRKKTGESRFSREFINGLQEAGDVHDLGKIGIATELLHKEGVLDIGEREQIQRHPEHAEEVLAENRFPRTMQNVALYHHERFDGKGYPKKLKGEQIPIEARIAALADILDAFILDRPYPRRIDHAAEKFEARKVFTEGVQYLKAWLPQLRKGRLTRDMPMGKRQLSWEFLAGTHDEQSGEWKPGWLQQGFWTGHFDPEVAEVLQHITEKDLREIYPKIEDDELPAPERKTERFNPLRVVTHGTNYVKDWWPHLSKRKITRDVEVKPPNPNVLLEIKEEEPLRPAP